MKFLRRKYLRFLCGRFCMDALARFRAIALHAMCSGAGSAPSSAAKAFAGRDIKTPVGMF